MIQPGLKLLFLSVSMFGTYLGRWENKYVFSCVHGMCGLEGGLWWHVWVCVNTQRGRRAIKSE